MQVPENVTIVMLTFVVMYQLSSRTKIHPVTSASVIVLVPLIQVILIRLIFKVSLLQVLQWSDLLTMVLQFVGAAWVFYRLDYDDTAMTWLVWGVVGCIAISFIIPFIVILAF